MCNGPDPNNIQYEYVSTGVVWLITGQQVLTDYTYLSIFYLDIFFVTLLLTVLLFLGFCLCWFYAEVRWDFPSSYFTFSSLLYYRWGCFKSEITGLFCTGWLTCMYTHTDVNFWAKAFVLHRVTVALKPQSSQQTLDCGLRGSKAPQEGTSHNRSHYPRMCKHINKVNVVSCVSILPWSPVSRSTAQIFFSLTYGFHLYQTNRPIQGIPLESLFVVELYETLVVADEL